MTADKTSTQRAEVNLNGFIMIRSCNLKVRELGASLYRNETSHMPNIDLRCDINHSSSCTKTGGVFNLSGLR